MRVAPTWKNYFSVHHSPSPKREKFKDLIFGSRSEGAPAQDNTSQTQADRLEKEQGSENILNHDPSLAKSSTSEDKGATPAATAIPPSLPLSESQICVAIDVSTSTKGLILSQEMLAISTLCLYLTSEAKERLQVLPWSETAHPIIGLSDIFRLQNTYGTSPSILCSTPEFASSLKAASLWLLLTDGWVEETEVKKFATGIAEQGLHGTACIVVVFGEAVKPPSQMDVSVGTAVFAAGPNCLFLFHDVLTGTVYILQCKGCFNRLLPLGGSGNPVLSNITQWTNLPQITYEALSHLQVPAPIRLMKDQLALSDGMILNMDDLYQNRLDRTRVTQILSNDDNLKTVLMTAATRGLQPEIEKWLDKQKQTQLDNHFVSRPDIGLKAISLTRQVIDLLNRDHKDEEKVLLQAKLRDAHATNWSLFLSTLSTRSRNNTQLNTIIRDSRDRISSMTPAHSHGSAYSPAILSPVSPAAVTSTPHRYENQLSLESRDDNTRKALVSFQRDHSHSASVPYVPLQNVPSQDSQLQTQASPRPQLKQEQTNLRYSFNQPYSPSSSVYAPSVASSYFPHGQTLCYTPEYHKEVRGKHLFGLCQLCAMTSNPTALLLKKPDTQLQTDGFPVPNERAKQAYPLAMGNFPETVIISDFVCCDACSFYVKEIGCAPVHQNISGAILITNWPKNFDLIISALDSALERRFSQDDLLPLFLGILYTTWQDLKSRNFYSVSSGIIEALEWLIDCVERSVSVSLLLQGPVKSSRLGRSNTEFGMQLMMAFENESELREHILSYPMDGFIVLVSAAQRNLINPKLIERMVCLRFLNCLTEQYYENGLPKLQADKQQIADLLSVRTSYATSAVSREVTPALQTGIERPVSAPASHDTESQKSLTRSENSLISFFLGGPLLTEDTISSFKSLGESFKIVERLDSDFATAFLYHLVELSRQSENATACFNLIREQTQLLNAIPTIS